jgi:O-antigen ligase
MRGSPPAVGARISLPAERGEYDRLRRMTIRSRAGQARRLRPQLPLGHRSRGQRAGILACGGALAVTVGASVFSGGGFSDGSQSRFVALAGVTLLLAAGFNGRSTLAATRSPLALVLTALAAICIASAAWTIGEPIVSVRLGLTIGGYAAVLVAAAALTRLVGPWPLALGIVLIAAIEAVLGLRALSLHVLPDAEPIGGIWRPGGTFEYPPALAILQLGAIPILHNLMGRGSNLLAGVAAVAAVLAGAVIGLSGSRLTVALAAVLLAGLMLSRRTDRSSRAAVIGVTAFLLVGALAAHVSWEGHLAQPSGSISRAHTTRVVQPGRDLLHGRTREWDAALRTWLDRPLLGAGGGAYYQASLPHQGSPATLYAHDLPLELAAELGACGLLLGIALYLASAWTVVRARHSLALELLGATVVIFLISNLVDWTWHLAGLGALWAASVGGLAGCGVKVARRR